MKNKEIILVGRFELSEYDSTFSQSKAHLSGHSVKMVEKWPVISNILHTASVLLCSPTPGFSQDESKGVVAFKIKYFLDLRKKGGYSLNAMAKPCYIVYRCALTRTPRVSMCLEGRSYQS